MKHKEQKEKAYIEYKKVKSVFCPYLNTDVVFSSSGFRHLIYKNQYVKRDEQTQLFRFKLLAKASKLLKITTTVQEQDSYKSTIEVKEFGERVKRTKVMQYYGFIAIIDGWKVKVIVKKIGNGEPFFWSIIPNWVTNKKRDLGKKYINFSGNLESD